MRMGIPEYRLPREVLQTEIDLIKNGVEIKTGARIDKEKFAELKKLADTIISNLITNWGVDPLCGQDWIRQHAMDISQQDIDNQNMVLQTDRHTMSLKNKLLKKDLRELLGVEVIGLDYPGHIATAVRFREPLTGDFVLYHDQQYTICDPTYIHATLGMAMIGGRRNEAKPYDEALGIATEESLKTALRVQQIVGYETGVCDTADPLAGSYFVEWLTSELEERVTKEIETVDRMGGAVKAIERGYFQRTIAKDAYQSERDLLDGKITRVGVNRFRSDEKERPITVYRAGSDLEEKRIADIRALRKERNNQKVKKALKNLRIAASKKASNENNLLPPLIEAAKVYATRGEITDVLREVWGEYPEPAIF